MKKLLSLLVVSIAIVFAGTATAQAQQKEKIVTGTINYLTHTSMKILDEYMAGHMYSGGEDSYMGWNLKVGAIYRKQENLSWDLYFTNIYQPSGFMAEEPSLKNPAGTQHMDYSSYNFGYGTYYHWQFGKKLMIKAGGMLDFYGALKKTAPDGVNNAISLEGQILAKAHAAIKYGWDFKRWALDIHGSVSLPVIGVITADHPSEPALCGLFGNDHTVLNPGMRHIFLGFYHNSMALDFEVGVDFVFRPCTITLGFGGTNRWWKVYGLQNVRQITYATLGVSFDIVSRDKFKTTNKNF